MENCIHCCASLLIYCLDLLCFRHSILPVGGWPSFLCVLVLMFIICRICRHADNGRENNSWVLECSWNVFEVFSQKSRTMSTMSSRDRCVKSSCSSAELGASSELFACIMTPFIWLHPCNTKHLIMIQVLLDIPVPVTVLDICYSSLLAKYFFLCEKMVKQEDVLGAM